MGKQLTEEMMELYKSYAQFGESREKRTEKYGLGPSKKTDWWEIPDRQMEAVEAVAHWD